MQGSIGLELAREHRPDLILLDLHLPDMGGPEVLQRLAGDPRTSAIPVVVLTADGTSGRAEQLTALGAHAFLTKPFHVMDFLEVVDRLTA
jgi:CheY-like chemotaxis protein